MTTKEYWRKIRAIATGFDPDAAQRDRDEEDETERLHLKRSEKPVWLISIANTEKGSVAGQVVLMKPYAAAERTFAQTHREATPEEIDTEEKRRAILRDQILAEDAERRGNNSRDIGKAIADALREAPQKPARQRAEPVAG